MAGCLWRALAAGHSAVYRAGLFIHGFDGGGHGALDLGHAEVGAVSVDLVAFEFGLLTVVPWISDSPAGGV